MFMSACVLARLHNLLYALLFVWLSFPSAFGFADSPASWRGQSVSEFTPAENKEFSWQIVNDGVMGGLSKGNVEHTSDNRMHFWGTLKGTDLCFIIVARIDNEHVWLTNECIPVCRLYIGADEFRRVNSWDTQSHNFLLQPDT